MKIYSGFGGRLIFRSPYTCKYTVYIYLYCARNVTPNAEVQSHMFSLKFTAPLTLKDKALLHFHIFIFTNLLRVGRLNFGSKEQKIEV